MKFVTEDFETDISLLKQGHGDIPYISTPLASNIANAKLQTWLDAAPTVYGKHPFPMNYIANWANKPTEIDTHTAKLVCIEEIKKECKHELVLRMNEDGYVRRYECKHCNAELVAEWRVK